MSDRPYFRCHGPSGIPGENPGRCSRRAVRGAYCRKHYAEEIRGQRTEAGIVMRRLGCRFRNVRPPLVVLPPIGFHFEDEAHEVTLSTWWDVTNFLASTRIVPCDSSCGRVK